MQSEDRRAKPHFDLALLLITYILMGMGVLSIAVATYDPDISMELPLLNRIINSETGRWQAIFMIASPVVIWFIVTIPYEHFRSYARLYHLAVLALLVIVLGASKIRSVSAWLQIGLGRMLQPSEFAKITMILMLARAMANNPRPMNSARDAVRVIAQLAIPAGITVLQREIGSVIVMVGIFFIMSYFGGTSWKLLTVAAFLAVVAVVSTVAFGIISGSTDHKLIRILSFIDPESHSDAAYQVLNSQQAIGSGGMKGIGLFVEGSLSQLDFVPEDWTDFIFATIGEAVGFIGCIVVLLMYAFLIFRMLYLARFTGDKFGRMIIIGVMAMISTHVFENIAMTIGVMPVTGIPLPFLSYGGSNLVTNLIGIGLVLNVVKNRPIAMQAQSIPVLVTTGGRSRRKKKIYVNRGQQL